MPSIKVYKVQKDGHRKLFATVNRVVWNTNPGFAMDDGKVSGTWRKVNQLWCHFDGERRLVHEEKGGLVLNIHETQEPKKQVLF